VDTTRIGSLLAPFLASGEPLSPSQLDNILMYINILLKWNARMNLTAVRDPYEMVTRHFGESLFAARHIFPEPDAKASAADMGSGAGFPGLPIKLWAPQVKLTLIESNQRKATFLREVARALALRDVEVFGGRAESYSGELFDVVTLRAVERFDAALLVAARLVRPVGRLALLIGEGQTAQVRDLATNMAWNEPISIPNSTNRVLLVGSRSAVEPGQ